jgi:hypothetical protein
LRGRNGIYRLRYAEATARNDNTDGGRAWSTWARAVNGTLRRWRDFFRLEIERKTDILAFAAFIISLTSLSYQAYGFLKGPSVVEFPPEQILFFPSEGGDYLHAAAQVTHVNRGSEGKNAVVKQEKMTFKLANTPYELKWQYFENFSNLGHKLVRPEHPEAASPIVIKAGEAVSKEIHFAPRTLPIVSQSSAGDAYKNFLRWDDFVSQLANAKELDVQIVTEFYGLRDQHINVFIRVTPEFIHALKTDRWDAPSCWPRTERSLWERLLP